LLRQLASTSESRRPVADDVVEFLSGLRGESQSWPTDHHVMASLRVLPAYTSLTRSRLRMVLEALEAHLYTEFTEKVSVQHDLTIEHVLPQEWHANWPLPSDRDPVQATIDRDALKHTIGNLTLVTGKLNPAMSNAAWPEKRRFLQEHSILKIASDLREAATWDEVAIRTRTERLATLCIDTWSAPGDGEHPVWVGTDDDLESVDGAITVPLPPITEPEFWAGCDSAGRTMFEPILAMASEEGLPIRWPGRGFSVNVEIGGQLVGICYCYPQPSPRGQVPQSVYTYFRGLVGKLRDSENLIGRFGQRMLATGLFAPVGTRGELRYLIVSTPTPEEVETVVSLTRDLAREVRALAEVD
jgi:hypothetical protein